MMPVFAVASLLSAPALPVEPCGMRSGQFRVGIVIAPASGTGRVASASVGVKKPAMYVVPVGVSTLYVHF